MEIYKNLYEITAFMLLNIYRSEECSKQWLFRNMVTIYFRSDFLVSLKVLEIIKSGWFVCVIVLAPRPSEPWYVHYNHSPSVCSMPFIRQHQIMASTSRRVSCNIKADALLLLCALRTFCLATITETENGSPNGDYIPRTSLVYQSKSDSCHIFNTTSMCLVCPEMLEV